MEEEWKKVVANIKFPDEENWDDDTYQPPVITIEDDDYNSSADDDYYDDDDAYEEYDDFACTSTHTQASGESSKK